ncbi:MAG: T9SS type A sorting domain-containing protein [Flavobacteriales bacterium]|jgi:hypothetical protein|nr:T9SS type A sorting domain-containing protein [Flavobacteriales bacterium]MBT5750372.1 T9SS type A sorting domain-containing protein [Flavobacteriales bacterium]
MKKLLLALFVAFGIQTQAQLWNVQLNVDPIVSFSPATGLAGVIWIGSEFWVSKWADNNIYTADALGNMTGNFTIPGITGTRSMTTDGNYIYIGTAAAVIYQVDPITKTLISTINTSVPACRYLTFDHTLDNGNGGFWTGAYASDIVAVSMTGTTLNSIASSTHGLTAIYGMAFDDYSVGGPYLWAFDQGGNGADIIQLTTNGTATGISYDATTLGAGGGTAGGLFICNNFVTGTNSMIGINQGISLFALELADPPADDPILTVLDIDAYVVNPSNVDIKGTIKNGGLNPITSIDVKWSDGTNTYTDNLAGLNISMNGTYNFIHSTQLIVNSLAASSLTIWIEYPADLDTSNNTLTASVAGLTSIPAKTTVGEEKTGTWCGWCPRGAVALGEMEATSSFIGIAVHNGDPMTISSYDNNIGTYIPGGYPGGGVDRVLEDNPAYFSTMHATRVTDIVPCIVNSITAVYDQSAEKISVASDVEFFGNIIGDFRLSCVIVEDDLKSSNSSWAQVNYYGPGGSGNSTNMTFPPNVNNGFSFNTANSPVPSGNFGGYDHVARSLSNNDILGDVGSLPSALVNVGTYNHTFTDVNTNSLAGYNDAGFNWTKAHAVVMIINATTGEILNAGKTSLTSSNISTSWDCDAINGCIDPGTGLGQYSSLGACTAVCNITSVQENNTSEFNIYPHPVKNVLTIVGDYSSADIYDVFGKLVLTSETQKTIDVSTLSNGVYLVNINSENSTTVKKFTISK